MVSEEARKLRDWETMARECRLPVRVGFNQMPKRDWFCFFGLMLVVTWLLLPWWRSEIEYTFDNTVYLAGCRSLVAGDGYRFAGFVGQPRIGFYPPLQSIWMAPWWAISGAANGLDGTQRVSDAVPWMNSGMLLLSLWCYSAAFAIWWRMGVPLLWRLGLVGGWALSPTWGILVFGWMSDVGFSALALTLVYFWLDESRPASRALWWTTGIGLAFLYWWRTAAVAWILVVGVAAVAASLRRRHEFDRTSLTRWESAIAIFGPCGIAMMTWKWMSQGTIGYREVLHDLVNELGGNREWLQQVAKNLWDCTAGRPFLDTWFNMVVRIPEIASRGGESARFVAELLLAVVFLLGIGLAFRGAFRMTLIRWPAWAMLLGLYIVQMIVMPFSSWHFRRYLFVLMPIILGWIWMGISCREFVKYPWVRTFVRWAPLLLLLNAIANFRFLHDYVPLRLSETRLSELRSAAEWIRDNTPSTARIAVEFSQPNQQLQCWSHRKLIVDGEHYLSHWRPLTALKQGSPRADYVFVERREKKETAPDKYERVFLSVAGTYSVWKILEPK